MREPPDWDRYSDREIQEAIATNAFTAARDVGKIYTLLCWVTGAAIGGLVAYQIQHHGWRSFFGGWL